MSVKCKKCNGNGVIKTSFQECTKCKGGKKKTNSINLMQLSNKNLKNFLKAGTDCDLCKGSGKIEIKESCNECDGKGVFYRCSVCGNSMDALIGGKEICGKCKKTIVYKFDGSCDAREVAVGKYYHAVVRDMAPFGTFVNLNSKIKGLIHSSNVLRPLKLNEKVIVYVKNIRPNGNMDLIPKSLTDYETIEIEKELPITNSSALESLIGKTVRIEGEIIQVKQTSGPTIFTMMDDGGFISCAAFSKAGTRSYPEIDSGMIVAIDGEVSSRGEELQIEVNNIKKQDKKKELLIRKKIEDAIEEKSRPEKIEFLVKSDILEKLRPSMELATKEIKKAIHKSKPIILRHHADADGMTAAIAIERAILPLIRELGDDEYRSYRRAPSKAPFYELSDVVKDISYAVEDLMKYGKKMPLVIMVDNGSTEEDVPAMKRLKVYGIDIVVIDHHHPDEIVDQYLLAHVNPAHVGGDFGITAGMLCMEVARMINPNIVDDIKHLAAVAAVGDRSESQEAYDYIKLVSDKYTLKNLKDMALALDFEAYWLRFSSGKYIIDDILNLRDPMVHKNIVPLLCEQAQEMIDNQLEACIPNVKAQTLENGVLLNVLDVEKYAHKFTFPPPGKTSGEVHDIICKKNVNKPVITIGYGPDFTVIRSNNVKMNIPEMVRELHDEIVGGGVNGGGHLTVGSIKFVQGMRKRILTSLVEKMSVMEINEFVQSD